MKILFALFIGLAISTTSCISNPFKMQVVKQPQQNWRFHRLVAFHTDEGTSISGHLTAQFRSGLPSGHVDIAAYSPSGEKLKETIAYYTPRILTTSNRRKGGPRFSVELTEKLPAGSTIKIAFHRDEPRPKVKPSHKSNIAH